MRRVCAALRHSLSPSMLLDISLRSAPPSPSLPSPLFATPICPWQHYASEIEWLVHVDMDEFFYRPQHTGPGFLRSFVLSLAPQDTQVSSPSPWQTAWHAQRGNTQSAQREWQGDSAPRRSIRRARSVLLCAGTDGALRR